MNVVDLGLVFTPQINLPLTLMGEKAFHTCYRIIDPVYRQVIHPVVGCDYFPPGLRLPSQPQSITALGRYQVILLGDRGT